MAGGHQANHPPRDLTQKGIDNLRRFDHSRLLDRTWHLPDEVVEERTRHSRQFRFAANELHGNTLGKLHLLRYLVH